MVARNPLFRGGWSIQKFNATVINDIWPEVFFFSLVATMVSLVTDMRHSLAVNPQLLTVLGTVLGLVISFRTSSAYERYQEGRKMWTNLSIASRNLAQMIWLQVPNKRRVPVDGGREQTELESIIEKKSMVNLIQALSVAVKHFLRGESGIYYQDLYPLICFLPRYSTGAEASDAHMMPLWHASEDGEHPYDHGTNGTNGSRLSEAKSTASDPTNEKPTPTRRLSSMSWVGSLGRKKQRRHSWDPEQALPTVHVHRPLKPARNPPKVTVFDYIPFLLIFKKIWRIFFPKPSARKESRTTSGRKRKPEIADSNVPLEITLFLSNYLSALLRTPGLIQPAIAAGMVTNLGIFQDTISNLERIATTPLPFAYQTHLRMSLWLYLFLLPFQVVANFGYLTIPGTAFAAFLLLGFLEIGAEIENPFNYDANDLDLDSFCLSIQRELHEITAHPQPDTHDFIFSSWNQPFAPADRRTAEELTHNGGVAEYVADGHGTNTIKRTLLKAWKDVDTLTRKP